MKGKRKRRRRGYWGILGETKKDIEKRVDKTPEKTPERGMRTRERGERERKRDVKLSFESNFLSSRD